MEGFPSPPQMDLSTSENQLAYYKSQYEQLEQELAEFQASSQELEAELEKDVEAAEKRERLLQEKAESLSFEVEEWKTKYKQSKTEANAAQNILQKEITTLRDANRTFQLKLRDIEVQNDDFERQARNTTSSLEDLDSKYNVAIERAVMMEEDIKNGEQERENLRIETQRLRDELSDLKIEAEIMQDKLQKRHLPSISTDITAPNSPSFDEGSPVSTASSPMITTPPDTKSVSTTDSISETPTPPSPPMSEASNNARPIVRTPMNPPRSKLRLPSGDSSTTPKPNTRIPSGNFRSSKGPATVPPPCSVRNRNATPTVIRNARSKAPATRGMPNSTSLTHIRSLTAQMQKLEQRVQSARSKLPAPVYTPPRASPRNGSALGHNQMPSGITIRSKKRTGGSTASVSSYAGESDTPSTKHVARLSTSGISRLSFGPLPSRENTDSRPSSRASATSYVRPDRPLSRSEISRPASRTSMSGARTPLGHYSQSSIAEQRRPRSSIGGNYGAAHGHGHSQSVSNICLDQDLDIGTPSRRNTYGKGELDGSAMPAPPSGLPRRQSGGLVKTPLARRTTSAAPLKDGERRTAESGMRPPPKKLSGVGETY